MKHIYVAAGLVLISLALVIGGCKKKTSETPASALTAEPVVLNFGGGLASDAFQAAANAIQAYASLQNTPEFDIKVHSTTGSIENLKETNAGKYDISVVYSGNVYHGLNGQLRDDSTQYSNVMTMAYLYDAPAQLVVHASSGINSARELVGKKIGIGNAGSGAVANSALFFTHLGIWNQIERNALGQNDAASAFVSNQLDAFWLFTAYPNASVTMAAQTNNIVLVDVVKEAEESGFFDKYSYFGKTEIPANTYNGVDYPVSSFFDAALWVVNKEVPADTVYNLLSLIYTQEGLAYMASQNAIFESITIKNGVKGVITPLHPGAEKFWKKKKVI